MVPQGQILRRTDQRIPVFENYTMMGEITGKTPQNNKIVIQMKRKGGGGMEIKWMCERRAAEAKGKDDVCVSALTQESANQTAEK